MVWWWWVVWWGVCVCVYTGEKGQIGSLEISLGNCPIAGGV